MNLEDRALAPKQITYALCNGWPSLAIVVDFDFLYPALYMLFFLFFLCFHALFGIE
jgi:hypothetical protein